MSIRKVSVRALKIRSQKDVVKHEKKVQVEFIARKREMFLLQYSLGVKQEEMKKLEELAKFRENTLLSEEKKLEKEALEYEEFLKRSEKKTMDAVKLAELEAKKKNEKIQEIKRLNQEINILRSEIIKQEEKLSDCKRYRDFLESVTPSDLKKKIENSSELKSDAQPQKSSQLSKQVHLPGQNSILEEDRLHLAFESPSQFLSLFNVLEEKNLFLIQQRQVLEESLEELKQCYESTKNEMKRDVDTLDSQINALKNQLDHEDRKLKDLYTREKMLDQSVIAAKDSNSDLIVDMLNELHQEAEHVYVICIGDQESRVNLSTFQILSQVENRITDLFNEVSLMDEALFKKYEAAKEKERRQKTARAKEATIS